MAGRLRIKISLEHAESFWMFLDTRELPQIVDIQGKIEQRFENLTVDKLLLDGCVLPSSETSELLRDNDEVHVKYETSSDENSILQSVKERGNQQNTGSFPVCKKQRKRKRPEEGSVLENVAGTSNENSSDVKRMKKSKNQNIKGKQERRKQKVFVTPGRRKNQQQKKKPEKKTAAKRTVKDVFVSNERDDFPVATTSTPVTENIPTHSQNEKSERTSEMMVDSSAVCEELLSSNKRRRRQRSKKQRLMKNQTASANTVAETKKMPAQLRVPKWQQGQNKKILFCSEGELSDEGGVSASVDQVDSQGTVNLGSAQAGTEDNSSFSECFSLAASPMVAKDTHMEKGKNGTSDAQNLSTGKESTAEVINGNISENVNDGADAENGADEENGDDEWYRDQQYQEKLTEEMNLQRPCPSALDKSTTPVHLYMGGHHEVVQPNLAEYLRMSPEERGATVPPYVTATRLSNGAMLYKRNPFPIRSDKGVAASPFKTPAPYKSAEASPRSLSKQQQLETVNTNKSIVVKNVPNSNGNSSSKESRNGNCSAEEEKQFKNGNDNQETIILTPVGREYSLFPDLIAAPKVGDLIAYKVLEMGEDYTPGISDYKEGEVLGYDSSTQNVTVKLLQPPSAKKMLGKFDLPEENPMDQEVKLELSSMFEPKLISSQ